MVPRAMPSRVSPLTAQPAGRRLSIRRVAAPFAAGAAGSAGNAKSNAAPGAKAAPATAAKAAPKKSATASAAPKPRRSAELRAAQAVPIHPDPFQRAQYHEVRLEAAVVGAAALATAWYFFVRPLGKLYRAGESGSGRPALSSLIGKALGATGVGARAGARAAQPLAPTPPPRVRLSPPPPPPPRPQVGVPAPPMSEALASMLAEAQQLEARMDAEVARLAAEEAARKAAADAEVARYAAALKQPPPRPARSERDVMDMAFPIKAAVALTELAPQLAERLEAEGLEAASGTMRKLAQEAGQAAAKTLDSAIKAGGDAVAAAQAQANKQ